MWILYTARNFKRLFSAYNADFYLQLADSFALSDHFQASQSHIYIYSNLEAAQYNNELLGAHRETSS